MNLLIWLTIDIFFPNLGLPKAAIISEAKKFKGASVMLLGDLNDKDIIYTTLPLYHSAAGVIAVAGTVLAGWCLLEFLHNFCPEKCICTIWEQYRIISGS